MTTSEDVIDELRTQLDDVKDANYRFRSEIHDLVNAAGTLRVSRDELKDELNECQDNYKEMQEEAKQMGDENFRLRTRLGLLVDRCNHLRHDPLAEVVYQERADLVRLRTALDDARSVITNVALAGDRHDQLRKWVFYAFAKSWLLKYPKSK